MVTFKDRFIQSSSGLQGVDVSELTDTQLSALSSDLVEMAGMVRRYSVLLKKTPLSTIYQTITEQTDPRIALYLAAAKDKAGNIIFPNLEDVKSVMFGPLDGSSFINDYLNLFVDGVREVSARLTASIIIGQLSQVKEQNEHSERLEEQAIATLNQLLTYPDLQVSQESVEAAEASTSKNQAFYFEKASLNLEEPLIVEVYIASSNSSGWQQVGTYQGTTTTGQIVANIADVINEATIGTNVSNVIAIPVLSGEKNLHLLELHARNRDSALSAEVISVRITWQSKPFNPLTFKWGVDTTYLSYETLNSVKALVEKGSLSVQQQQQEISGDPVVLYFRRSSAYLIQDINNIPPGTPTTPTSSELSYRTSTVSEVETVQFIRATSLDDDLQLTLDNDRPSQLALDLCTSLHSLKASLKLLGALIRNDNMQSGSNTAYAAVELLAYSRTPQELWLILDILNLPPDIELAVGNLKGPVTQFSNKPRSVRVVATLQSESSSSVVDNTLAEELRKSAYPRSFTAGYDNYKQSLLETINTKVEDIRGRGVY